MRLDHVTDLVRAGPVAEPERTAPGVEAVIFDWGGTLTPWHTVDFDDGGAGARAGGGRRRTRRRTEALHAATQAVWGRPEDDPRQRDARRHLRAGRADPRRGAADGVPRVLGAAHAHRPRRAGAVPPAARGRDQGRRAVQHGVAARLARGVLRARRGARPHRRRGLHQRGAVDQAAPRGVPRRDGGGRRRGPGAVRLRRRPALRRHLGRRAGRHADDPHAALARSRPSSSATARASRTRWRTGSPRSTTSSAAGA